MEEKELEELINEEIEDGYEVIDLEPEDETSKGSLGVGIVLGGLIVGVIALAIKGIKKLIVKAKANKKDVVLVQENDDEPEEDSDFEE